MSGKVSPWGNAVGFVPPMTRNPGPEAVPPGNDFVRQNTLVPGTTQTGASPSTPPGPLVGGTPVQAGETQAVTSSVRYDANRFTYSDPRMYSAWEQNERQQITSLHLNANGMPT